MFVSGMFCAESRENSSESRVNYEPRCFHVHAYKRVVSRAAVASSAPLRNEANLWLRQNGARSTSPRFADRENFIEIVARQVAVRSSWLPIHERICFALKNDGYHHNRRDSRVGRMLITKLLQTRKADAELPQEIRAALIESLFAPIASLVVGAAACSIVGASVALRVGDLWIMANSVAILAVGMLRVASALFYQR